MTVISLFFTFSLGACFGVVLMGFLVGGEAPKPYGSHQEWHS